MLRIRFSRTGKVGQPSFRIVVIERRAPAKGKYIEMVGNYLPARKPKSITFKKDRIEYWISKGALPTESIASLLKKEGVANMDRFLRPGLRKGKKKGEETQASKAPGGATDASPVAASAPESPKPESSKEAEKPAA